MVFCWKITYRLFTRIRNSLMHRLLLSALVFSLLPLTAFADDQEEDFIPLAKGKWAAGWQEAVIVKDNIIEGDGFFTERKFGDFVLRFDFKLKPGSNSGIGIRGKLNENAAYSGMEIQVLENTHPKYANLKQWQYHGSIYGVVPAKRGHLKPTGEWNTQEILAKGDHIKVTLNGVVIVDARLKEAAPEGKTIDGRPHPGLFNKDGYLRICGHGGGVQFKNMRIKLLDKDEE